jgi:hypothetical protein
LLLTTEPRLLLDKEFGEPAVKTVRMPVQQKKELSSTVVEVPYRDPEILLLQELEDFGRIAEETGRELEDVLAPACKLSADQLGDELTSHPAYAEALEDGIPMHRIFPVALYLDGVQYSNNESFLNFQMTHLTTSKQWTLWVLRFGVALQSTHLTLSVCTSD